MTTGQPIRVPSDRNKFNNEFMENLRLQIRLNDSNLQANRLYQNTGQLPPSVQMSDNRSTSEKLADIEGLKKSIVADLKPVAESGFAYAIIDGVLKSPLNIDNSLFRYLAQNAHQLGIQLSKKYKFGIAGDANDVEIIVQFLEDAYNKTKNTFQSIKGYMNSTTNFRSSNTNLQEQIIQELKYFMQRLSQIHTKNIAGMNNLQIQNEIIGIEQLISEIISSLPSKNQMEMILNDLVVQTQGVGEQVQGNLYEQEDIASSNRMRNEALRKYNNSDPGLILYMVEVLEKLPNPDTVRTLLNNIIRGIEKNSLNIVNQSIFNLKTLFSDWVRPIPPNQPNTTQVRIAQFKDIFLRQANEQMREENRINRIATINQIKIQNQRDIDDAKAQRVYVVNPGDDPVKVQTGFQSNNMPLNQGMPRDYSSQLQGSYDDYLSQVNEPTRDFSRPTYQDVSNPSESYSNQAMPSDYSTLLQGGYEDYLRSFGNFGREEEEEYPDYEEGVEPISRPVVLENYPPNLSNDTRSKLNFINAQERLQLSEMKDLARRLGGDREADRITDHDTFMNFLSNRAGRNIPGITQVIDEAHRITRSRGSGLKKKGRGLSSDYRKFGINKINHKKLDDGILTLRRGTNSNIPDMPSKRISRKLQKIIKHISGGGMPDFNDINNLDNNEKDYLHKLISKSNLTDRLSVPAPSKDQEEKDFHEFEVLKGEIMAGNDSKELVKKFKILILKLSKQNVLPKNEVSEILQDLLTLGY